MLDNLNDLEASTTNFKVKEYDDPAETAGPGRDGLQSLKVPAADALPTGRVRIKELMG